MGVNELNVIIMQPPQGSRPALSIAPAFSDIAGGPLPLSLSSLHYIRTERDAAHETPVLINFVSRWMEEHNLQMGLACLDLLREKKKKSVRDDKVTPGIIHELSQACYTIALAEAHFPLPDIDNLLGLNFSHDIGEEYDLLEAGMVSYLHREKSIPVSKAKTFGHQFELMTKKRGNVVKYPDQQQYFDATLTEPETVMAKLLDRIHNMATMIRVKRIPKQREYVQESIMLLDTLKQAETLYPQYQKTFSVLNQILTTQIFFTTRYLNQVDPGNERTLPFSAIPRLKEMKPLPRGLDPLQITQARAYEDIMRREAQKPEPPAAIP